MQYLRTNTATRITVGPFIDPTDGVTPETALTVTNCKLTFIVDDAGVPTLILDTNPTASGGANDMVHITGDDAGFYDLELAAANVNYLGRARLALTDATNHCPVFQELMIIPANIYDSMILGTDLFDVSTTQFNGSAVTAASGRPEVNLSHIAGAAVSTTTAQLGVNVVQISGDATAADNEESFFDGTGYAGTNNTIPTVTNVTTVNGLAANVITAASMAADAGTEIAAAVWDRLTSALTTVGSIGKLLVDNINATITSRASQTSVDTIDDFLDSEVAAILADTNELQTDWANGGRLDNILDARASQTSVDTIDGIVDDILVDTAEIGAAGAGLTNINLPNQTMDIVGNITGSLSGTIGGLTPAALKDFFDTDSLTTYASAVAGSVVKEIADNAGGSSLTAAAIADAVWEEAIADHDATAGSTAEALSNAGAAGTPPTAAAIADAVWDEATAGHTTGGTFGEQLKTDVDAILADTAELQTDWVDGGRLDLILDARASQTSVNTIDDFLDTEIAAILAAVDTEVAAIKAVTDLLPNAGALTSLATAASITTLSGKVDVIDDFLDTEIAAILADTDELQQEWADGGRLDLILDARASQAAVDIIDDFLDTEVAAILAAVDTEIAGIKGQTDLLTFSGSNVRTDMRAINGTTVNGNGAGTPWGP